MSHSKEEKLQEIYAHINRQIRKSRIYLVLAAVLFISAIGVSWLSQYFLPPYDDIAGVGAIGIVFVCVFLGLRYTMILPSYEKRLFRQIFSVYRDLTGYLKISDATTFRRSLASVILPLHNISKKLWKKKLEGNSDIIAETNRKYAEIGKNIKTKIIGYIQQNEDGVILQRRILELAAVFSDVTMVKINSYLDALKDVPDRDFQSIPSKFDTIRTGIASNPLLRIGGKYIVCLAFVAVVAYFLSIVLSRPVADWGGHIIIASFALLAAVEFGSRAR